MTDGARGVGGVLIGGAAATFAVRLDMPGWEVMLVFMLVTIGLPLVVTGRWSRW